MGRNPKKAGSKKKSKSGGGDGGGGSTKKGGSDDEWEEGLTTITGEEEEDEDDEMMDGGGEGGEQGDPNMAEDAARQRAEVWRPGVDGMEEDEELEYDPTAYDCLHAWSLEWPCLSFDIIRDELGDDRTHFPHTLFAIAGTQAEKASQNSLTLMRVTRLKRTRRREKSAGANGGDDSEESDSD
eukprot:CAMPEP_0198689688 /NCGR_PEP_ID=MMETSP1468-20131203/149391_1 /TAXON_ID=1461545 /ORGANISM="Mantoniella sp, Strain CCMP1436" /LENGTH=182 /DNA_ID=CAMNT_0044441037 /DNA_START=115 /DNA_END=660 /DNA_ORIENTATION=+